MSEKDVTTPEQEVNTAPEETVNDTTQEESTEPTAGDLQTEATEKKQVDSVPIARLNKEIERRKELEAKLAEATSEAEKDGATKDEAEKLPEVKELAEKLATIEAREESARKEKVFAEHLQAALESNPEFKGIANPEVIKQMAFNPANKDKTYSQLLDEAYGSAVPGRKTIETTTPRGGVQDVKIDLQKAERDPEYRKEVLRDPELKKQYNEGLEHRIQW